MEINLSNFHPTETYLRDNTECFLCNVRKRLIKRTPEELIRQAFINYLVLEKNVPLSYIDIEYPLTRIKKGDRKRADIIVYSDEETKKIVLVVECKKDAVLLTERAISQVKYYNEACESDTVIITNGIAFITLSQIHGDYERLDIIPTFSELLNTDSLEEYIIEFAPWTRHALNEIHDPQYFDQYLEWGHIGEDTKHEIYPFIINLIGLFYDKDSNFEGIEFDQWKIIKDLGVQDDSFGNASGGSWGGEYRKLLIKDKSENHQVLGIGMFGKGKTINDPKWGTSTGYSCLIVSIDDFEKSHNSLQLSIDRGLKMINSEYVLCHDGRLTNGHSGSVKVEVVKKFISEKAPNLLDINRQINLGKFKQNELYTSEVSYCKEFVKNLLQYAILRDELRRVSS